MSAAVPPQSGRIGADEVIDDMEGKESEELEEILNEKEAKTRAILLEMVTQPLSSGVSRLHTCAPPMPFWLSPPPPPVRPCAVGGRPP